MEALIHASSEQFRNASDTEFSGDMAVYDEFVPLTSLNDNLDKSGMRVSFTKFPVNAVITEANDDTRNLINTCSNLKEVLTEINEL